MSYSPDIAAWLVRTLESGIPCNMEMPSRQPSDARTDGIELELRRCSCNQADYRLSTTLYWEETTFEKGKRKIEEKTEDWFQTMIPASLGRQLETILFPDTPPTGLKAS